MATTAVVADDALDPKEVKRLTVLEGKIEKGLKTFFEVGRALVEINDKRLYRESHKTFADYCEDRWSLSRASAYRHMDAAKVVGVLSPIGDTVPRNEATARPLAALLDQPDMLADAWSEAQEFAEAENRQPMAEDVIGTAAWKEHRKAKIGKAVEKTTAEQPEKTPRARLLETLALITEIPAKVANIDLEAVGKIDTRKVRDERVQIVQDADAALMELMEALEPSEAVA
jgi:hypothetical protein